MITKTASSKKAFIRVSLEEQGVPKHLPEDTECHAETTGNRGRVPPASRCTARGPRLKSGELHTQAPGGGTPKRVLVATVKSPFRRDSDGNPQVLVPKNLSCPPPRRPLQPQRTKGVGGGRGECKQQLTPSSPAIVLELMTGDARHGNRKMPPVLSFALSP